MIYADIIQNPFLTREHLKFLRALYYFFRTGLDIILDTSDSLLSYTESIIENKADSDSDSVKIFPRQLQNCHQLLE